MPYEQKCVCVCVCGVCVFLEGGGRKREDSERESRVEPCLKQKATEQLRTSCFTSGYEENANHTWWNDGLSSVRRKEGEKEREPAEERCSKTDPIFLLSVSISPVLLC